MRDSRFAVLAVTFSRACIARRAALDETRGSGKARVTFRNSRESCLSMWSENTASRRRCRRRNSRSRGDSRPSFELSSGIACIASARGNKCTMHAEEDLGSDVSTIEKKISWLIHQLRDSELLSRLTRHHENRNGFPLLKIVIRFLAMIRWNKDKSFKTRALSLETNAVRNNSATSRSSRAHARHANGIQN